MTFSSSDVTSSRWGYQTFDGYPVIRSHRGMNGLRSSVRRHDTLDRRDVSEIPQADIFVRCPNLVALHLSVPAIRAAELAVLDLPRALASLSHFDTHQGAVDTVIPGPMHAICQVAADNLEPYLFCAQQPEWFVSAGVDCGGKDCHDHAGQERTRSCSVPHDCSSE